jgi:signal transduction histidine kinase
MNRIEDILMQLSSFSKIQPVELKPCRVNGLVEDSLSLIQYDSRVQDITVVRDLSPGLPTITTDGNQLSQVIVDLVLNAADAMPNGGTLTIRTRLMGGRVEIEFQDTGVGIDQKDLTRIFDPFYSTKENASGLGLAVCSSIVKKLNGTITAESDLNKGTRFVVSLPVSAA